MVDSNEIPFNSEVETDLILERTWGVCDGAEGYCGYCRSLHNFPGSYELLGTGRHFWRATGSKKFAILKYVFSPWTDRMIARRLQIQERIPQSDKDKNLGTQHIRDKESIQLDFTYYQNRAENLKDMITKLYKN
jgi:ADP-heptose:LPS heptosyltransferase